MSGSISRLNAALEGRYRIEGQVGEGGMAAVYLAEDLKHGRRIALKVLKSELAAVVGAERFLAEIKTTANLQHPHILPLHDSGDADGSLYYVMPYVEDESLRQRLDREHQLPVDEAVRIATNMAEALDYAHRQGVIHRDIKPANVLMLDAEPVISDFGIALAVGASGGRRLTETGLSLGTPHYMSPEQATGDQSVGAATDVYALGCVLYEMLVGDPPHTGRTAQAILGKIIAGTPDPVSGIRRSVPANVDAAIRKSLEKLPADRFARALDFAGALADPAFRHGQETAVAPGRANRAVAWLSLTVVVMMVVSVVAVAWALRWTSAPQPVEVLELAFAEGQGPVGGEWDLSPDGSTLVYLRDDVGGARQLWLRRWDDLEPRPIEGTENAGRPSIAPDGRRLAFAQDGMIKVVAFDGGLPTALTAGRAPKWGPDGFVYASTRRDNEVLRVLATGGDPETLTRSDGFRGTRDVSGFLPNGWPVLSVFLGPHQPLEVQALDPRTGDTKLLAIGRWGTYVETGQLLYIDPDGTLTAAELDTRAVEVVGTPMPVYTDVGTGYALSEAGKMLYEASPPPPADGFTEELVWVDRSGGATPVGFRFNYSGVFFYGLSLSPTGDRVAVPSRGQDNDDIWVKRMPDGPRERLTTDASDDLSPWWTTDGESVTYLRVRDGSRSLWSIRADGSRPPQQVLAGGSGLSRGLWSSEDEWLLFGSVGADGSSDILGLRPGIDSVAIPLVATRFTERMPALSPNGRWLAYASDVSGRLEIYVRPFPNVDSTRVRVSTEGGTVPVWAHSGRELFFVDVSRSMVSARLETASGFTVLGLDTLFPIPADVRVNTAGLAKFFDVSPDDQRFVMGRSVPVDAAPQRIFLVNGFFEVLRGLISN